MMVNGQGMSSWCLLGR